MMTTRDSDKGLLVSRCMAVAAQVIHHHHYPVYHPFLQYHYMAGRREVHSTDILTVEQESGGVDLYFHTNTESGKTDDLDADSSINIAFLNGTGEWASISGIASVISDRDVVKKYYSQELRTWVGDLGDGTHDGSENDPRIGVIKVEAKTATYAIARGTAVGRAADMVQGAITGNAAQVNKLREISESEISQYRSQHKS